jgi:hypothetical protein
VEVKQMKKIFEEPIVETTVIMDAVSNSELETPSIGSDFEI